jgi:hypothetical protein
MPRFTVRRLMVAVAIVGIIGGGYLEVVRLARLSEYYWGRAIKFRRLESMGEFTSGMTPAEWQAHCEEIDRMNRVSGMFQAARGYPPELARRLIAYAAAMIRKYERAARYPWLPVEPDPPWPQ